MIGALIKAVCGFVFDNMIGKALVGGLAALALLGAWLWQHDAKVAARAETKVIAQSKEAGKVAHAKARKAHDAAARPGAAERVLKYCRDC